MKNTLLTGLASSFAFVICTSSGFGGCKNGQLQAADGAINDKRLIAGVALARATENIEPLDTCRTLPLDGLVCAAKPASDLVVNVKEAGAKGDGKANDTKAIQTAINWATGSKGTVLVPPGTYLIDPNNTLRLGNDMTFKMADGARLKAMPTDKGNFAILMAKDVANVNIIGGIIQGERNIHKGKTGEWGIGLRLAGSKNVVVENVIAKDNWGDGFYVSDNAVNSRFCGVIGDNNRRFGLAIVSADGVVVKGSTFQRNNGYIGGGIDIEPNGGETVQNYEITDSSFIFNQDSGLVSVVPQIYKSSAKILNGKIANNLFHKNGKENGYTAGILISQVKQTQIHNNIVKDNVQNGILVVKSSQSRIYGNQIKDNGNRKEKYYGSGIFLEDSIENEVENNDFSGSAKFDVYDATGKNKVKEKMEAKIYRGND